MSRALNPLDLLTRLVGIYSPTGQEAEAVEFLADAMQGAGFRAQVDPAGNAVGVMGDGKLNIVLLGHIDTVPGEIPIRVEGGRLYGRGTVDAKGPLAAFVAAVAAVGPQPGRRFTVIGAVGEEGDSRGARYVVDYYGPPVDAGEGQEASTARSPLLIIGEPSGWQRITLGYRGSLWAEYRTTAEVSHTASQGQSACEAAVEFWNRVAASAVELNLSRSAERVFDQLTPTLRGMRSASDGFTDEATLHLGLRLPPEVRVDDVIASLHSLAGDGTITIEPGPMPAYRAEKNTPLVRAFLSAIRSVGGSPSFTLKTGTSDMNIVAPRWGGAAIAYGPGDSSLDHTPHEHILLDEYYASVSVLASALSAASLSPSN